MRIIGFFDSVIEVERRDWVGLRKRGRDAPTTFNTLDSQAKILFLSMEFLIRVILVDDGCWRCLLYMTELRDTQKWEHHFLIWPQ